MRIYKILECSQSNGPGKRFTIWVQGCSIHCPYCVNHDTWDFNAEHGKEISIKELIEQIDKVNPEGITITGGEPLDQFNSVLTLLKELFHKYNIFLTSGYTFEKIDKEILKYIDILISGPYINYLYSDQLLWRGSSNQEIHYLTQRGKDIVIKEHVKAEVIIDKTSATVLTTGFSIPKEIR